MSLVDEVRMLIPSINILLDSVEDRQQRITTITQQITTDLSKLREKISISRGDARTVRQPGLDIVTS